MSRTVSTSKKRKPMSDGTMAHTKMVITLYPAGKNKKGKSKFYSVTTHEKA